MKKYVVSEKQIVDCVRKGLENNIDNPFIIGILMQDVMTEILILEDACEEVKHGKVCKRQVRCASGD